jgi:hypothetical protein
VCLREGRAEAAAHTAEAAAQQSRGSSTAEQRHTAQRRQQHRQQYSRGSSTVVQTQQHSRAEAAAQQRQQRCWEPLSLCSNMSRSGAGPFIYTGSGKNQAANADPCVKACRKNACELQLCLSRNGSMQTRCENYVQGWKDCCDRVKTAIEEEKGRIPVPGASIEQREQGVKASDS